MSHRKVKGTTKGRIKNRFDSEKDNFYEYENESDMIK